MAIGIENNVATVTTGKVVFDDKNAIDLTGHGTLQPPYPFQGGLTVDLTDLSRFGPVLAANGVNGSGREAASKSPANVGGHLATSPDAKDQQLDGDLTVTARALEAKGVKIQSVDTHVDLAGNKATITTGSIKVDGRNGITFGGSAGVDGNHPFEGFLDVNLPRPRLACRAAGREGCRRRDGEHRHRQSGPPPKPTPPKSRPTRCTPPRPRNPPTTRPRPLPTRKPPPPRRKATSPRQSDASLKVGGSFRLQASAKGHLASSPEANDPSLEGTVDISGENIQAKGAKIEKIEGHIVADNEKAVIKTFQLRINDKNTVDINGQALTKAPFDYQASLNVNLADLGVFLPLINTSDEAKKETKAKIEAAAQGKTPAPTAINGPTTGGVRKTTVPANTTTTSAGKVKVDGQGHRGHARDARGDRPAPPGQARRRAARAMAGAGQLRQGAGGSKVLRRRQVHRAQGRIQRRRPAGS